MWPKTNQALARSREIFSYKATAIECTPNQIATFTFAQQIPVGPAVLEVEFEGEHNDHMNGFYRSQYKDAEGNTKHLVVTQFEACDARQAFPCWDEPAAKATFSVTLVVPFAMEALSNMPVKEITAVESDVKTVYFEKTPIMSTYVSFIFFPRSFFWEKMRKILAPSLKPQGAL